MSATAQSTAHTCTGCLDRREVLVRAGLVTMGVAAAGVLAACGGSEAPASEAPAESGGALAQLADIPVGGAVSAKLADGQPIILVQPEKGTVVALTAVCTHQQCTVAPEGDELRCPCHGSVFDLTGANVSGPAPSPLAQFDVHVSNGAVLAGKA
ncbi:QcrA and Rieske domain-containing protein [Cellulomonas xylanilytica]|uniref:Cytochrome bc1 complex Rieske iron-sulfur subunit n=1 Tax=Cellulomonas xylanilytica TaxID=233583 RepID=A0A510V7R0_9CELL|nr:Rieske (2Fe-2S) protein [Cellulomonas xylanilytica]GEK21991.1 iron-sulfur protein [Cellulomonas xylanilytica]